MPAGSLNLLQDRASEHDVVMLRHPPNLQFSQVVPIQQLLQVFARRLQTLITPGLDLAVQVIQGRTTGLKDMIDGSRVRRTADVRTYYTVYVIHPRSCQLSFTYHSSLRGGSVDLCIVPKPKTGELDMGEYCKASSTNNGLSRRGGRPAAWGVCA